MSFQFDTKISVVNVFTILSVTGAFFLFLSDLRGQIAVLQERDIAMMYRIDANAHDINVNENLLRSELKEIREAINSIDKRLGGGDP